MPPGNLFVTSFQPFSGIQTLAVPRHRHRQKMSGPDSALFPNQLTLSRPELPAL